MADWRRTDGVYTAPEKDGPKFTAVVVGDENEGERSKFVLQNHPENKGLSLETEEGQFRSIDHLCRKGTLDPKDFDWFVRDDDNKLRAIDVETKTVTEPNPSFLAYESNHEFNPTTDEAANARKKIPDVQRERLSEVSQREVPESELRALEEALGPKGAEPELKPHVDLAQEYTQLNREDFPIDL